MVSDSCLCGRIFNKPPGVIPEIGPQAEPYYFDIHRSVDAWRWLWSGPAFTTGEQTSGRLHLIKTKPSLRPADHHVENPCAEHTQMLGFLSHPE